jgi:hypothetical protein
MYLSFKNYPQYFSYGHLLAPEWISLCACIPLCEFGTLIPFDVLLLNDAIYLFHV